jgi:hypothetical protein
MPNSVAELQIRKWTRFRGMGNLLDCKEVSSAVPYNAGILVLPILLTGERVVKCGEGNVMKAEG